MKSPVSSLLVSLAESEFPRLMHHETNREDALQTLALVQCATGVNEALTLSRHALAWLQYELGIVPERPRCGRPRFTGGGAHETSRLYREDLSGFERGVLFGRTAA